jgi:hypothetical protein
VRSQKLERSSRTSLCRHRRTIWKAFRTPGFAYSILWYGSHFPDAWVVECTSCGCVITCLALDPQSEHMYKSTVPPSTSAQVACPCCLKTYRYSGGKIRRGKIQANPACRRERYGNRCSWDSSK